MRLRALLTGTVASISLFAQAAVVAHALLVPHTTCLAHGSAAHESGHAHATSSHETDAATPQGLVRADDAHPVEDEHCSVLGTRHPSVPPVFAAPLTERPILGEAASVEAPAITSGPAAYRLAPKTSPPRA